MNSSLQSVGKHISFICFDVVRFFLYFKVTFLLICVHVCKFGLVSLLYTQHKVKGVCKNIKIKFSQQYFLFYMSKVCLCDRKPLKTGKSFNNQDP